MEVYKANKYYTTMNCDTFLILGTDEEIMHEAHELQLKCIRDNYDENCKAASDFISENGLIYLDDISDVMEIGRIDDTHECVIQNGNAYIYEIVNNFVDRF